MTYRIFLSLLVFVCLGTFSAAQDMPSKADEAQSARLRFARSAYEEAKATLTLEGRTICERYLEVLQAHVSKDTARLLAGYKELYELCKEEVHVQTMAPKKSTLWTVFQCDFSMIPETVAAICCYSKEMTTDEKIAEMKTQMELSNAVADPAIGRMIVDLLHDASRQEEAISFCEHQLRRPGLHSTTLAEYRYMLVRAYLAHQMVLYRRAMESQGISADEVVNKGPELVNVELVFFEKAEEEAKKHIQEDVRVVERYVGMFHPCNPYVGCAPRTKIAEFYDFCLNETVRDKNEKQVLEEAARNKLTERIRAVLRYLQDTPEAQ